MELGLQLTAAPLRLQLSTHALLAGTFNASPKLTSFAGGSESAEARVGRGIERSMLDEAVGGDRAGGDSVPGMAAWDAEN